MDAARAASTAKVPASVATSPKTNAESSKKPNASASDFASLYPNANKLKKTPDLSLTN
jgi:hypothetical protein